jgi:hypothetical protein
MKAHHLHRAWDQPTSVQAADAIEPSISEIQELVEEYAYTCGVEGFTDVMLNRWFNSYASTYRSRRAELVRLGRIRDSGRRDRLPTGRKAIVWVHVKQEGKDD